MARVALRQVCAAKDLSIQRACSCARTFAAACVGHLSRPCQWEEDSVRSSGHLTLERETKSECGRVCRGIPGVESLLQLVACCNLGNYPDKSHKKWAASESPNSS